MRKKGSKSSWEPITHEEFLEWIGKRNVITTGLPVKGGVSGLHESIRREFSQREKQIKELEGEIAQMRHICKVCGKKVPKRRRYATMKSGYSIKSFMQHWRDAHSRDAVEEDDEFLLATYYHPFDDPLGKLEMLKQAKEARDLEARFANIVVDYFWRLRPPDMEERVLNWMAKVAQAPDIEAMNCSYVRFAFMTNNLKRMGYNIIKEKKTPPECAIKEMKSTHEDDDPGIGHRQL